MLVGYLVEKFAEQNSDDDHDDGIVMVNDATVVPVLNPSTV